MAVSFADNLKEDRSVRLELVLDMTTATSSDT